MYKQSANCGVWFLCQVSAISITYTAHQSGTTVNGPSSAGADVVNVHTLG